MELSCSYVKYFRWFIKNWRHWKNSKYSLAPFFIYLILYPLPRLLFGKRKSPEVLRSILSLFKDKNLIVPLPIDNFGYYIRIKDSNHFSPLFGIYLEDCYDQSQLKTGMNVIDIGAHIGMYTVLAAEKVGNTGKVIAIEPELKNYKQLIENIDLNGFKNIISQNIALADYEGSGKLYFGSFSESHSLIFPEDKNSYIEVPVKTLDNLLEELNLRKVDIIKIDAEGAEVPILKGAEKTLKANPNCKVIVASYHYPSQIKEVSQFLNDRGFKTKVYKESIITTI